jgi:cytochrome c peroxidase
MSKTGLRKRTLAKIMVLVAGAFLFVVGCKTDPSFKAGAVPEETIEFIVPQGWPAPVYNFENNTLSNAGFELGRKLFYDTRLSRDNSTSCGTCHQAFAAFAHLDHNVSHGIDNKLGTRNSPPIFNMNWHTSFFWDGGVNHIESQPINPIQNPVEMDESIANVVIKVQADEKYKAMFKAAWGDETVTSQRIFKSLAQFMGMMVSSNAKYDKYVRGESGGDMNASELNGLQIFKAKCTPCHKEPLFSDFSFRNNGLPTTSVNDSGRAHITHEVADLYKFKVPSLRNLKYTYPYMHDGRFSSLQQVLDYYTSSTHNSAGVDPAIGPDGITLSAQDKTDLINFLNTLNDETFVKDKRFHEVQ